MKKCISASSSLLVTAMMVTLSFGCGEGIEGDTGSQSAQLTNGQCNAIVARVIGTGQQCNQFGCEADGPECAELSLAFGEFFGSGCGGPLGSGDLNGVPGNASTQPAGPNAGGPKHMAEVVCGAIEVCGFCSDAQNLGGICITTDACNAEYTQDFESLDQASPTALSDDGWQVFGQVFDGSGAFKFGYGPFPAPNGTPGFSSIVAGQGGPDQGAQQLVVYNDYNCCGTDQGHFNGTDRVASSVFQQPFTQGNEISADDVGKTLEFSFDAKRGNINDPTGSSTALAFIQTLDPGFTQTNFVQIDMTNLPAGTWDRYSISLTIDAGLVGQYFEFGFLSTASNFEPSGVFYDNIRVVLEAP